MGDGDNGHLVDPAIGVVTAGCGKIQLPKPKKARNRAAQKFRSLASAAKDTTVDLLSKLEYQGYDRTFCNGSVITGKALLNAFEVSYCSKAFWPEVEKLSCELRENQASWIAQQQTRNEHSDVDPSFLEAVIQRDAALLERIYSTLKRGVLSGEVEPKRVL